MNLTLQDQIAAFRYSLIAPIVCRQTPLAPGELKTYLEETSRQVFEIPGSTRGRVSVRTLERYLSLYRNGGYDTLKPQPKKSKGSTRIPADIIQEAIALRQGSPERSVEQIIFLLEERGRVPKESLAHSTLARHLRKAGVSRKELLEKASSKGHRRFEAEDAHVIWQSDFQHTLYLPDPKDPKRRKKAILFAILDDYSRLVVHAQFYWEEKLPRLEESLKKGILRHGIPEQFYCDNGAVFSSLHLARVCGKLGIRLSHSRPYRPAGRGKIERFFRFVDTSFKPEAYEEIESGKITSLEELNQALTAWIDGYYHCRVHGGTGETPKDRVASSKRQPRRISVTDLTDIFLWEEERKVDKTGCIKVASNLYEVDLELVGQKVLLRYDPFDISVIQIWHDKKRYADAVPINLVRSHDRRVRPEPKKAASDTEGVSFFQAAERKRQQSLAKEPLTFASKGGNRP
jgi:transposase InsO family protein